MSLPPLSHHEILALAGPFARRGRHADLAASDRAERRLAFRPRVLPAADGLPPLHEALHLDGSQRAGHWRLVRTLALPDGPSATLAAEGDEPGALLERIESVPAARQFQISPQAVVALQQRAEADGHLSLQRAQAQVAGLTLEMRVSGVSGFPAELELRRAEDDPIELPRDVLAVLGGRWDRLTTLRRGWLGSVQVKGEGAARSADAEAQLHAAIDHLSRTLAEPPLAFHQRHLRARWRVAMRGTLPVFGGFALVGLAILLRQHGSSQAVSALGLLANLAPPLMMGLFFVRREMPQIGLPRVPRRPRAGAWR